MAHNPHTITDVQANLDEPHVNWLALSDDEALDLRVLIADDMPDVAERLRLILFYQKPYIVEN